MSRYKHFTITNIKLYFTSQVQQCIIFNVSDCSSPLSIAIIDRIGVKFLKTALCTCAINSFATEFLEPFAHSVWNYFLYAKTMMGMVTKMGISRLLINEARHKSCTSNVGIVNN